MEYFLEKEFKNPDKRYRGAPFWAWNTKLEKETLLRQIEIFKEMGFGGYHIHTRVGLDTEYLGKEFLELVKHCVEKGKDMDLLTYLYDEDRWPSGFAGGKVTKTPEYRVRHLLFTKVPYQKEDLAADKNYMANFAVGVRSGEGELLACYDIIINTEGRLTGFRRIEEGDKAEGEKWYAYAETNPAHSWYNGGTYVDVLNKRAIDFFLQNTHEVYKAKLGHEFGKYIPAIFTDEPHMLYKENLPDAFSAKDVFMPWTEEILSLYKAQFGIELLDCIPELFWELPEDRDSYGRYCYHKLLADLFEMSYAKNIGDWCGKNGIGFTGHYLYEETLFMQNRSDGDLLRMYRHMDLPGMDLLFNEVDLTTAKQVQSIVHQYGKKGAMSELYGVTNWSFDFRGYKFQGDWQAALGITLRVPHLSLMTLAGEMKRDFPASIFYQAPWYREFKQIENHFARINLILEQGNPCVRLAVIHPIESYWTAFGPEDETGALRRDMDQDFMNLINWLLTGNIDFDYLSEGLLPELCPEVNYPLQAGQMRYEMVLVPNCISLRESTIMILEKFARAGGSVVVVGDYLRVSDGKRAETLRLRMEGFSGRIPFSRHDILKVAEKLRDVEIRKMDGTIHEGYIHQLKQIDRDKILFIAPVKEPVSRDISTKEELCITLKGTYNPICYDTFSGRIYELPAEYEAGITKIRKVMYGYDSLLLWLKAGLKAENTNKEVQEMQKGVRWLSSFLETEIAYELEEPNVLLLDMAEVSLDGEEYTAVEEILRIDTKIRKRLNLPLRTFSMAQPYTRACLKNHRTVLNAPLCGILRRDLGSVAPLRSRYRSLPPTKWSIRPGTSIFQTRSREKKRPEHILRLRYHIESNIELEMVSLALEEREQTVIVWNGERISNVQTGWYVDEKIQKVCLGRLLTGINILELELPFGEDTNLEPAYLLGNFGVRVTGRKAVITSKPEKITFGSVVGQNLDFYSGNLYYCLNVNCPEGKLRIRANKYRGALIGVYIDDERKGSIIFPPYEFDITGLAPGMHRLKLCLFGNRYNTFSHLHSTDESVKNESRPSLWRTEGEAWCYEYVLVQFGILKAPEIYV